MFGVLLDSEEEPLCTAWFTASEIAQAGDGNYENGLNSIFNCFLSTSADDLDVFCELIHAA